MIATLDYYISTEKKLLDIHKIWLMLKECFWCENIPISLVEKFVDHSLCFGAYHDNNLLGFGRVISDFTTYAYVTDIVVDVNHRKKGIGTALIQHMRQHPDLQNLKTWSLRSTTDGENIYKKFGFEIAKDPHTLLEIDKLDIYL